MDFQDIYQDVIERQGFSLKNDPDLINKVKRWCNIRYKNICAAYKWPFLQDHGTISTLAEYTTGTIATDGTTSITGSSTVWIAGMTGRKFKSDAESEIYRIAQRSSNTAIVLDKAFAGDDETAGTYTIFQDEYLCPLTWADITSIRQYSTSRKLRRISLNEYRSRYLGAEPQNADPLYYTHYETKSLTRINIDPVSTKLVVDEIVTGGTSSAYGRIKKSEYSYIYVEILYGTFSDGETLTDETGNTATVDESDGYVEGNIGGILKVMFWPVPYQVIRLDCDVILKPHDMALNNDEPLIPDEYRDSIIYGASADLAKYKTKIKEANRYEIFYRERINQMAGELIPLTEQFVQIIPDNQRLRYGGVGSRMILDREDY